MAWTHDDKRRSAWVVEWCEQLDEADLDIHPGPHTRPGPEAAEALRVGQAVEAQGIWLPRAVRHAHPAIFPAHDWRIVRVEASGRIMPADPSDPVRWFSVRRGEVDR